MQSTSPTETIECPLCAGAGELRRAEILDRLGVKDFARVAQLSAGGSIPSAPEQARPRAPDAHGRALKAELAKRTAEIRERLSDELRLALSEKESLSRRVEDSLREVVQLREQNQQLETEMAKVARVGRNGGNRFR